MKIANGLLISSGLVAIATEAVLYLPISMELKAILLGNNFYWNILIIAGIAFIGGYLLIRYGGEKKYQGTLSINKPNELIFNLNKNNFSVPIDEIESIQYVSDSDGDWEWRFLTTSDKFTLIFEHIVERYKADNALQEILKDNYNKVVIKE